jgi:MFS family permease
LRGWGVAFLTWVAASTGLSAGLLSPAVVITVLGLLGTVMSVLGNEASIRLGRRRLIIVAMGLSIVVGAVIGFVGANGYWIAVGMIVLYGMIIWLDSSSLTAGAAGSADPSRRGAQLAVHSMLGYAGGFIGPLAIGWTLDLAGGMSPSAWGLSFVVIAVLMALGLGAFMVLRPRDLEGDRA